MVTSWKLDSSTFIHAVMVKLPAVLTRMRKPISFMHYVYEFELVGPNAHNETREAAKREVARGAIQIDRLTLADVTRMSRLAAPRRIHAGELATAVVAERVGAGVLCDDRAALKWLRRALEGVKAWESIEDVIVAAAESGLLGEHELAPLEESLRNKGPYHCRFPLHAAYAQLCLARQQALAARESNEDGE
jgi:hypothetical protein